MFHSLKAMQDVHLCMYVCMYVCTVLYACVYVYIYVSQRDFRLMSFTAGRCGTPLIVCSNVPSEPKADRDEPRSADERSESAGVGPKAPGGRAKRGRRRQTERPLRTEPHWSFSTVFLEKDAFLHDV